MKPPAATHRTRSEKRTLVSHILRYILTHDFTIKDIAYGNQLSLPYAHYIIRHLGYRHMILSKEERDAIMSARQEREYRVLVPKIHD